MLDRLKRTIASKLMGLSALTKLEDLAVYHAFSNCRSRTLPRCGQKRAKIKANAISNRK